MITAVDTNVLLDVFASDPVFGPASRRGLEQAVQNGGIVACEVVWAEVAAWFSSTAKLDHAMDELRVRFVPLDAAVAAHAGRTWRAYLRNGGKRRRILADFLIAAHATTNADRLLTRDQGFYRKHFAGLTVLDPTTGQPSPPPASR